MPWFPFYVDDFIASPKVRRMNAEEVGVYVMLLCEQFQTGVIDGDLEELATLTRSTPERVEKVLSLCFTKGAGGFYNPRLRSIVLEKKAISKKRADAAKARHRKDFSANASNL